MTFPRLVSSAVARRIATPSRAAGSSYRQCRTSPSNDRSFATITGGRGSRGHGWYTHYRRGEGGRHLQGEYHDRPDLEQCEQWNDAIFQLGSQQVYLDVEVHPVTSTELRVPGQVPVMEDDSSTAERQRLLVDVASTVLAETSHNFCDLCTAQQDGYTGTLLYRFEPKVGICGGDVLTNTGHAGKAVQADLGLTRTIRQDPLALWHVPGTVTMVVKTVDEIDSRFILCTQAAPHLDGIYRAFGRLTPESLAIVQDWQANILTRNGAPTSYDLVVVGSGLMDTPTESSSEAAA